MFEGWYDAAADYADTAWDYAEPVVDFVTDPRTQQTVNAIQGIAGAFGYGEASGRPTLNPGDIRRQWEQGAGRANEIRADALDLIAQRRYENQMRDYEARNAHMAAANAHRNRVASARAAAARQAEANKLKAMRQARRQQKRGRRRNREVYRPYIDTGHKALAQHMNLFDQGAGMVPGLLGKINAPQSMNDRVDSLFG